MLCLNVYCAGCSWIKTVDPRGMSVFIVDAHHALTHTTNTYIFRFFFTFRFYSIC